MNANLQCLVLIVFLSLLTQCNDRADSNSIAVADMEKLMRNAAAIKSAREQIAKINEQLRQQLTTERDLLNGSFQALAQERAKISAADVQKRMEDLQQRSATLDQKAENSQRRLDAALNAASQKVAPEIARIASEIMKERKLDLILPRSASIGVPTVPDVTDEMMKRLDQALPKVAIELPLE